MTVKATKEIEEGVTAVLETDQHAMIDSGIKALEKAREELAQGKSVIGLSVLALVLDKDAFIASEGEESGSVYNVLMLDADMGNMVAPAIINSVNEAVRQHFANRPWADSVESGELNG